MSRAGWLSAAAAGLAAIGSIAVWQTEPSTAAASVSAVDGATLFRAKGCASCHRGPQSSAATGSPFPSLVEASAWAGDRRPGLGASEYLAQSIRQPGAFISPLFSPGSAGPTVEMPDLGLSDAEIDAVVDYLLSG